MHLPLPQRERSRERVFSTILHIALVASFFACTGSPDTRSNASEKTTFRAALLTPGTISDQSWNAGAYQGLIWLRDSLGAQISHIETKSPAEFEENFRQYGQQGYDLVIGHGSEFQDAAKSVAPQYPKTVFAITSGAGAPGSNLVNLVFGFAEPSYLAGIVGGGITRTQKLGLLGGVEIPPVRESFRSFEAGARSINPGVKVITSYIGNWEDVSAGREQALAQLANGVDVIFQNADAAGLGIFQAVRQSKGAYIFGTNSNQNSVAPSVTLGSVVIELPRAFLILGREVKDHTVKPGPLSLGMRDGVVTLVMNPTLQAHIPAPALHAVDSVKALMLSGRFASPNATTSSTR